MKGNRSGAEQLIKNITTAQAKLYEKIYWAVKRLEHTLGGPHSNLSINDNLYRQLTIPMFSAGENLPARAKVEAEFFSSLIALCRWHSLAAPALGYSTMVYPYNILLAMDHLKKSLAAPKTYISVTITEDVNGSIYITVRRSLDSSYALHYLPIRPIVELQYFRGQRPLWKLLLSISSYLYMVVGVPSYTDDIHAISYYYEITRNWIIDDEDSYAPVEFNQQLSELNWAAHFGHRFFRQISHHSHLHYFGKRIRSFRPVTENDELALQLARRFFNLYQLYPQNHIAANMRIEADGPVERMEVLQWHQYISFVADRKNWLHRSTIEMINDEMSEVIYTQEPTTIHHYHHSLKGVSSLDFEEKLFAIFDDYIEFLNDL